MKKIINSKENVSFQGLTVSDLLDKGFLDEMKKLGKEVDPISLIFMIKESDKDIGIHPVVLGHNSNKDLKEKIMNVEVESPSKIADNLTKLFESMELK